MSEEETNYLIYLLRKAENSSDGMDKIFFNTTCNLLSKNAYIQEVRIDVVHQYSRSLTFSLEIQQ